MLIESINKSVSLANMAKQTDWPVALWVISWLLWLQDGDDFGLFSILMGYFMLACRWRGRLVARR